MKRIVAVFITFMMVFLLLAGCAAQPAKTSPVAAVSQTAAGGQAEPTPKPTVLPTPEPTTAPCVPEDIFGSIFNPFAEVQFPEYFNIYSAAFDIGDPKLGGKPRFVLSMTAEDKTDEAIAFLAQLAGIEESSQSKAEEFKGGGFCEFQSADGKTFTIRKTDAKDDRYDYVEGCHIDISINIDGGKTTEYKKLISDNYNLSALAAAADYFNTMPSLDVCGMNLNRFKGYAEITVAYDVKDAASVQQQMAKSLKPDWYDEQSARMGISYGMIDIVYSFDCNAGKIYVSERLKDFKTSGRDYTASEVSLVTLGFYYADKDALCIYEDKQNGISIAVHKPEWGTGGVDWNIEFLLNTNKYLVAIWYMADEQKYRIQADKDGSSAAYEYDIAAGQYGNEWPDPDTVKKQFGKAFDLQNDDVYPKALDLLNQTVKDLFGMSVEELYALPAK